MEHTASTLAGATGSYAAFRPFIVPALMSAGVWLDLEVIFVSATAKEQELVKNSKSTASMQARCLQLSSQHNLMKEICKSTENDSVFLMIALYGMSSEQLLAD